MHAITHGLANDDIYLSIEIIPRHRFNAVLFLVLFYDLSHHVNVLKLSFTLTIDDTVHFFTARLNCKKGIQQIDAISKM